MGVRHPIAFDVHAAHRGGIQQNVDQMVGQQVDLVDVKHTAVRARQQARREGVLTVAQHLLQIQRSDDAILGGADRQLHQLRTRIGLGEHRGQCPYRGGFGGALLAADEYATDLRAHRAQQQCQPQPVVADDGAQRVARRDHERARSIGTCGIPSSTNSSPATTKPCLEYISTR